jgi:hypothetical protein
VANHCCPEYPCGLPLVSRVPLWPTIAVQSTPVAYHCCPECPCGLPLLSRVPLWPIVGVQSAPVAYRCCPEHPCSLPLLSRVPLWPTIAVQSTPVAYHCCPEHPCGLPLLSRAPLWPTIAVQSAPVACHWCPECPYDPRTLLSYLGYFADIKRPEREGHCCLVSRSRLRGALPRRLLYACTVYLFSCSFFGCLSYLKILFHTLYRPRSGEIARVHK